MRHKALTRTRLLPELHQFPGHILLCAPSGWGKSTLMRQYAQEHGADVVVARSGDALDTLLARRAHTGHSATVLIDDAWLLPAPVVSSLLGLDPHDTRVVLAVRHLHYPRVHLLQSRGRLLVLDAADLAFTVKELYDLHQRDDVGDLYTETQGWPHLSAQFHQPMFRPEAYLTDLMEDLDPAIRARLESVPMLEMWDAYFAHLQQQGDQAFTAVMNSGLPIVPAGESLALHPYFWAFLLNRTVPQASTPEAGAQALQEYVKGVDAGQAVAAVAAFFDQHGDEAEVSRECVHALVTALQHIGLRRLTPALRDKLAHLLVVTGQTDDAREVLMYQRDQGSASSLTYTMLARLANFRNDFVTFRTMVPLIHKAATSDYETALAYNCEALLHLRLDSYEEGLRAAERAYEYAVLCGDLEVHVIAVARVAYYHQMAGHLDEALTWSGEAIKLMSSDVAAGKFRRSLTPIYNIMGDMLKDSGRHEEALVFIREGLAIFQNGAAPESELIKLSVMQQPVDSPVGYLYNQRGLVYTELGRFEDAIEAFKASIDELERVGNKAAILLPLGYICYPLYRLGQTERISYYLDYLRMIIGQSDSVRGDHGEHRSYLPLAEGLHALSAGNRAAAKEHFARIRWEGALTYDSTLLAYLYTCKLALEEGKLDTSHAVTLAELLDARGSPNDITAVMFADEFKDVYAAIVKMGTADSGRFQRMLSTARQAVPSDARHTIQVTTLGQLGLAINGQPVTLKNNYPVYVLAYLALQDKPVTAEELGEAVWTGKANARNTATTAISMARKVLRDVDQELKDVIADASSVTQGRTYTLARRGAWTVQVDAEAYLSPAFSPENPDTAGLWAMLEQFSLFLPRTSGSEFAEEINSQLVTKLHAVAGHLATYYAAQGQARRAAHALLLALRTDFDPAAVDQLAQVAPSLSERDRGAVDAYLALAVDDDAMWDYLLREAHYALTRLFGEEKTLAV
ncbi:hypothetical protein [Deinococcus ficus]|uniref:Uncharacterized protein n=1 Tax=Deinococcus ficus TaxID=317577 RepID=A0A221T2M7_9DEIO|nr:hypothetical protein [Deinococcus ficus]ASN83149.1 hypothetical protein DFI_18280 [Deinococcus ficus]